MEIMVMMRQSALVKQNKVAQASDDHFMGDAEVTGSAGRICMVVARGVQVVAFIMDFQGAFCKRFSGRQRPRPLSAPTIRAH